jgi:hypothetical protein
MKSKTMIAVYRTPYGRAQIAKLPDQWADAHGVPRPNLTERQMRDFCEDVDRRVAAALSGHESQAEVKAATAKALTDALDHLFEIDSALLAKAAN